ncbi:unnamed protein product [Owenia fusiformis]|uniref:EGF-like domain-containing protein n=1 Tax=Owenia fusiformis TaxID=6347 RepID=A0A8S4PFF1_OWEFU|nr:unnamed protein product [Owenia fusiformis]
MKKSLHIFLAIIHLAYCKDEEDECRCEQPKRLDPAEGATILSDGLNCGSSVQWKCAGDGLMEEPISYQTCENGKWVPEFEGDPWCEKYLEVNPCIAWSQKGLCKNRSFCMVDGETSNARCFCRPYSTGLFCDQPSDEFCAGMDCGHGDCEIHEEENSHYYTCTCHDGWIGRHCDTQSPCVKANREGLCKGGSYCKPSKVEYMAEHRARPECQCRPFTTGTSCDETSEEYCSMPEYCKNGECTFHDGDRHYYTCECHEGWFGATCDRNEQEDCARWDTYYSSGFCLNGGVCYLKDFGNDIWDPRCRCPETTTGMRCETQLNE